MPSSSDSPSGRRAAKVKTGSHFSDRQIAHTVKDGRAVKVLLDGIERLGWVFGSDAYHWGVVSADGTVSMVHKTAPCLDLTELLLADQPEYVREVVEPKVGPYRNYVMREIFTAKTPAAAVSEGA